jgi:hypothetical protein
MPGAAVIRWIIAGRVEAGRPLPTWLRGVVNRSIELQKYEASLRGLNIALGDEAGLVKGLTADSRLASRIASAVAGRTAAPATGLGAASVLRAYRLAAACVVMVILVVIGARMSGRPGAEQGPGAGPLVGPMAGTVPAISGMLSRDKTVRPLVKLASDAEEPIQQEFRAIAATAENSLRAFMARLPKLPPGKPELRG